MTPTARRAAAFLLVLTVGGAFAPAASAADADPPARMATPAVTPVGTVSLPVASPWGQYTMAPDGTFWVANGGASGLTVTHYDDDGSPTGESFTKPGAYYVQTVGVLGDRVFITTGAIIYSWLADGSAALVSDSETNQRAGGNQAIMRVQPNGGARFAYGQVNKVALINLGGSGPAGHPFYSQVWFGAGINDGVSNTMQGCVISAIGPFDTCAKQFGKSGPEVGKLNYPIDTAQTSDNRIAVLENASSLNIPRVSIVNQNGPVVNATFGSFGSGNGQLDHPFSIVREPHLDHYFIADQSNLRISEFTGSGQFVASYGQGVLTGGGLWEACGPGLGTCGKGNAAYYGRLDLGPDGRLYAQYSGGTIQILKLAGAVSVRVTAKLKTNKNPVPIGTKAKLTATVGPKDSCSAFKGQIQWRNPDGKWKNLGKAKTLKKCKVKRMSKEMGRTKVRYRSLAVDITGKTVATSATLTLKPKRD